MFVQLPSDELPSQFAQFVLTHFSNLLKMTKLSSSINRLSLASLTSNDSNNSQVSDDSSYDHDDDVDTKSISSVSLSSTTLQSPEFAKRKQQQKLFFIAKELCSSEEVFVNVLHLLTVDFRSAVTGTLPDEVLNNILRLLTPLQQINEQLLAQLKTRIENWQNDQRISGKKQF